jgi:hypothetical protein
MSRQNKVKTGNQTDNILFFQIVNEGFPNFVQGKTTFRGHDVRMQLPFSGHLPQNTQTQTPMTL